MEEAPDSAELWRLTLLQSPICMAIVGLDGRMLSVNQALCDMIGHGAELMQQRQFHEIAHPGDRRVSAELFAEMLAAPLTSDRVRLRFVHADGRIIPGDVSVALVRADDARPIHFIAQVLEGTEKLEQDVRLEATQVQLAHQQTTELAREQQILAAIFETVNVGLLLIDGDGRYLRMNRRQKDNMGVPFPDGHDGTAGRPGPFYALTGRPLVSRDERPSVRAGNGEEFDDFTYWVGDDPRTRRAFSVSSRQVRGPVGDRFGSVLAYQDITDLVRAKTAQDEFVSSVSHELRTPLTAILGHLELLSQEEELPPDVQAQLRIVLRNSERLHSLVSDLLHVAEMEDGQFSLRRATVDLTAMTYEAVDTLRPVAEKNGVVVEVNAPDHLPAVVDEERIRQVMDNLLSNALKYTHAGGQVAISLIRHTAAVEMSVTDTGIGIGRSQHDLVFDPFFRGIEAIEAHVPGTGLGLNIVRKIVAAHDGATTLESVVGQGSTFRVTLPQPPV